MLRKKSPSPDANVVPDIICEKKRFFFLYKFIFFKDHSLDWPYSITTFCKFLYITTLHSSWPEQPGFFFHSISYLALFIRSCQLLAHLYVCLICKNSILQCKLLFHVKPKISTRGRLYKIYRRQIDYCKSSYCDLNIEWKR